MKFTKVETQAEFDAAVATGDIIQIYNDGSFFVKGNAAPRIVTRETSAPTIETWGTSAPTIETWGTSAPTIVTRETSAPRIVTRGTSAPTIETWGTSAPTIETWGTSAPTIVTRETSAPRIVTWESTYTRDDIWAVLCSVPHEILQLREAIILGLINGQVYSGECACLVGTLEKSGNTNGLKRNSQRPAELWFLNIKQGDTPKTNQFSALALKWIDEILTNWGVEIPAEAV